MEFFERLAELKAEHLAFATATVVGRRSPVSSHLGDRAIVFADGKMEGFVGGSCSRDIVRKQALASLRAGRPRLLRIRPDLVDEGDADGESVVVPMGCASEGAVDVYIEPHVASRSLVVVGFTPVADALSRLGATLDYAVVRVVAAEEISDVAELSGTRLIALDGLAAHLAALSVGERARVVAVVASQGHYDEASLEVLLAARPAFVGLLASRKRAATVRGVLAQQGATDELLSMIRNPVGLDIGARSPGEVAVSILAEIIEATPAFADHALDAVDAPPVAPDPVCGMEVEMRPSSHYAVHRGHRYFFCSAGCRSAFVAAPERYESAAHR